MGAGSISGAAHDLPAKLAAFLPHTVKSVVVDRRRI
jgi:hypothetical protein